MPGKRSLFGVIGGMGPMASAAFLNYVYSKCPGRMASERDFPRMLLVSDPLAPDRAASFENDDFASLQHYLEETIERLNAFGVDQIIVCCLVAHACLDRMGAAHRRNVVSITRLLDEAIKSAREKPLLLSTTMFYELNLLDEANILRVSLAELAQVYAFIGRLKVSADERNFIECIAHMESLARKYRTQTIALACSELHLVNRFIEDHGISVSFNVIDAIELAADYVLNE